MRTRENILHIFQDYFILPNGLESNDVRVAERIFCLARSIVNGNAYKGLQGMLYFADLKIGRGLAGLVCSSLR